MAVEKGFNKPSNKVVAFGTPFVRTMTVETADQMYPGRLVVKGTNDNDVSANDNSGNAVAGWLGFEQAANNYRPATIATAYGAGDFAPVLNGPGIIVKAKLATGETITRDEALTSGTNPKGCLTSATVGTDHVVAIALESVTTTSSAADIWVLSLI